MDSILNDVKKSLDLDPDYKAFDQNIIMLINGVLSDLSQLGVGPLGGFFIEDDTALWEEFLGTDPRWNMVKPYIYRKVKMTFDPPSTSFVIQAFEKMNEQAEFRISFMRETQPYGDIPTTIVLDGGEG